MRARINEIPLRQERPTDSSSNSSVNVLAVRIQVKPLQLLEPQFPLSMSDVKTPPVQSC